MRLFNRSALAGMAAAASLAFAAAPAAAADLTMYYPVAVGGPVTKIVDGMTAAFTKEHPDIKVTAVYAGNYDDTRTKALAALKAGQPVQLSVLFSIDVFELIDQGMIVPFEDVVKTDEDKAWLNGFYPALMANGKAQGKTWGIPFQRSTIVLYYNKDAFREAGLDPEKAPATWADMQAMGEKLVKKDAAGNVERYGVMVPSTGYPYWMFQAFAKQNGQVLMNQDGTETYFDRPKVVEALSYWRELGEKGVMPSGTVEWGTLRDQFLQGKTAMMWHTTGNLTAVRGGAKFDFGVAMLPAAQERGSPTGGGNFYIFEKATPAEREAALTFIKWMTAPERAAQWSIDTGYVAVTPAAYETEALKNYVADFPPAAVARDQLQHSVAEFSVHENARVKKALDDAIQATLTGSKEPKAALAEAQATAERILKRYR